MNTQRIRWALANLCVLAILGTCGCAEKQWTDAAIQQEIDRNLREPAAEEPHKQAGGKLRWDWDEFAVVRVENAFGDEWHPPQATKRSMTTAPSLRRGEKRNGMSTWRATGAGDANVNGLYTQDGTHNGEPAYTNGAMWLYFPIAAVWAISATLGSPDFAYQQETGGALPGNPWITIEGTAPAPTVSLFQINPVVTNAFGWPYASYWAAADRSTRSPSNIAPCVATLDGVKYIVLPYIGSLPSPYPAKGFLLFNTATLAYDFRELSEDFWLPWATNCGQVSGVYDAGDGEHVWAFSSPYLDGTTPKVQCAKYSLLASPATQVSVATITLPSLLMTNPVQLATPGSFRFLIRDNAAGDMAGALVQAAYTAGDATYTAMTTWDDFESDEPPPVGKTESKDFAAGSGMDHRLLRTSAGELFYMRRLAGGSSVILPYRITSTQYTRLQDLIWFPGAWGQAWGEYSALVGAQLGEAHEQGYYLLQAVEEGGGILAIGGTGAAWIPGQGAQYRDSFTHYPAGRCWFLKDGLRMYAVGWGRSPYGGCAFVLYAAPVEVALGHTANANTSHALSFAYTLPLGHTVNSNVSHALALNEVQAMPLGHTASAARSHPLTLVASTVRTPAACTVDVYEVRAMALPA